VGQLGGAGKEPYGVGGGLLEQMGANRCFLFTEEWLLVQTGRKHLYGVNLLKQMGPKHLYGVHLLEQIVAKHMYGGHLHV
jgi:hypothetical protein